MLRLNAAYYYEYRAAEVAILEYKLFSLEALLLHPLIGVGIFNNPLQRVENTGFLL